MFWQPPTTSWARSIRMTCRVDPGHSLRRRIFGTQVRVARGGSVPGAVHIEWTDKIAADGTFKSNAELKAMYHQAGITPDKEVISYCQGGYRAAHSYVALRLLGFPKSSQLSRFVEGMGRSSRSAD